MSSHLRFLFTDGQASVRPTRSLLLLEVDCLETPTPRPTRLEVDSLDRLDSSKTRSSLQREVDYLATPLEEECLAPSLLLPRQVVDCLDPLLRRSSSLPRPDRCLATRDRRAVDYLDRQTTRSVRINSKTTSPSPVACLVVVDYSVAKTNSSLSKRRAEVDCLETSVNPRRHRHPCLAVRISSSLNRMV
jgi:hypothetical protein